MANYTSNDILYRLNEQEILTREDYTFVEYVDNLMRFQEEAAKIVIGGENTHLVRMSEIISRCEAAAREKNMLFDPQILEGLRALRLINKEIAVAVAGKRGEKRVSKTLEYITRPDAKIYSNVYISDGNEETEMDSVVLTKNGIIILEIKNAKEDITISPEGRILFNNSSCFHDNSIGIKMNRKRRLLKKRLEKEFIKKGIEKDVVIDSFIVFSTPDGVRINVNDQFKKEKYCFRSSLTYRIDGYENDVEYTSEEFNKISVIIQKIETEQKRFSLKFNPEDIKNAFANTVEALFYTAEEEKSEEDNNTQYYEDHYQERLVVDKKWNVLKFARNIAAVTVVGLIAPILLPKTVAPMVVAGSKIFK